MPVRNGLFEANRANSTTRQTTTSRSSRSTNRMSHADLPFAFDSVSPPEAAVLVTVPEKIDSKVVLLDELAQRALCAVDNVRRIRGMKLPVTKKPLTQVSWKECPELGSDGVEQVIPQRICAKPQLA